jgi:hypothetical protein
LSDLLENIILYGNRRYGVNQNMTYSVGPGQFRACRHFGANPPGVKKDEIEIKIKKMQNKHIKTLLKIIKNNVQVDNQEIMKTHCILKFIPLVV